MGRMQYPIHQYPSSSRFTKKVMVAHLAMLTIVTALMASDAFACAACGCTLSQDWMSQGVYNTPGFSVDLSYNYINQNQVRYGSGKASSTLIKQQYAAGQEYELYTKTQTILASINYVSEQWNLSVQLPYMLRDHGTYGTTNNGGADIGANFTSSAENGIGDVRIVGMYKGFSTKNNSGIIIGIKLPTGSTTAKFNYGAAANTALDPSLQLGTGSTDVILGGFFSGNLSKYGWFFQGTLQRALTTKNDMNGNYYRPGDTFSINTGVHYAGFGAKLSPMLQLNITKRESDTGIDVPNDPITGSPITGGTLAYLSPGISYRLGGGMSVYGFIQLPIYQYVNSLQLTPRYIGTIGIHQSF